MVHPGGKREIECHFTEDLNVERVESSRKMSDITCLEEFEIPWPNENELELQHMTEPKETPVKKCIETVDVDRIPRPQPRKGGTTNDKAGVRAPVRLAPPSARSVSGSPRMNPAANMPKRVMSFDGARTSPNNSSRPNSRSSTPVRQRPTTPVGTPIIIQRDSAPLDKHNGMTTTNARNHVSPSPRQELSFSTRSPESQSSLDEEHPAEFPGVNTFSDFDSLGLKLLPRTLLPWSVFYNESIGKWVAALNTNPKALENNDISESSRGLKALTAPTEEQAKAYAMSYTPPKMLVFEDHPKCFTCDVKFTIFRRACHCRNCGVCICNNCSVNWPAKMIPSTYNTKNESRVSICKSCDALSHAFRLALLQGSYEQAVRVFATRNINVITPFMQGKGEIMYPIHCAVIGGNLDLLRFLVDELYCPLNGNNGKRWRNDGNSEHTKLLTSKGRSLLRLAIEHNHVAICRYLMVEKRMSLAEEMDLSLGNVMKTLDCVIHILPESALSMLDIPSIQVNQSLMSDSKHSRNGIPSLIEVPNPASDNEADAQVGKECVICFSNEIDCVASPCGHHFCCLECSTNLSRCPICMADCTFMRVYWQV